MRLINQTPDSRKPNYSIGTRVVCPFTVYTEESIKKDGPVVTLTDCIEFKSRIAYGIIVNPDTTDFFIGENLKKEEWYVVSWYDVHDAVLFTSIYVKRVIWTYEDFLNFKNKIFSTGKIPSHVILDSKELSEFKEKVKSISKITTEQDASLPDNFKIVLTPDLLKHIKTCVTIAVYTQITDELKNNPSKLWNVTKVPNERVNENWLCKIDLFNLWEVYINFNFYPLVLSAMAPDNSQDLFPIGTKVKIPKTANDCSLYDELEENPPLYLLYQGYSKRMGHALKSPTTGTRYSFSKSDGIKLYSEKSNAEKYKPMTHTTLVDKVNTAIQSADEIEFDKKVDKAYQEEKLYKEYLEFTKDYPSTFYIKMNAGLLKYIQHVNREGSIFQQVNRLITVNPNYLFTISRLSKKEVIDDESRSTVYKIFIPAIKINQEDYFYIVKSAVDLLNLDQGNSVSQNLSSIVLQQNPVLRKYPLTLDATIQEEEQDLSLVNLPKIQKPINL